MKLLILSSLVFVIGATLSNSNCADELPLAVDGNQDSTIEHIVKGSFDFEGRARYYEVFLPEDYSRSANLPLMIYLHAYDWNPSIGMDYTRMNMLADTSGYIVVCPSAINRRWNSGIADNPNWPTPDVNDVGFINALIDTLDYNFSIDLERIYACGFSNGGYMSYKLACQLSHRIAAIASVGGIISENSQRKRFGFCTGTLHASADAKNVSQIL